MKIDMHCHVAEGSSDSKVTLREYINSLKEQGFDGMLITDHDSYDGYRYYEDNIKDEIEDFVVLKGIEYDTFNAGHFIVILPSYVNLGILEHKGLPVRSLIHIVHSYGGILGPAHPCGEPFLSIFSTGRFKKVHSIAKDFDFIEGFNCGEDEICNERACEIAKEYDLPITSGSDSHRIDCVGLAYTILEEDVKTVDELIDYFKKKKPTEISGQKYMGTIKEHLGVFNKLLVYGFFPYNKAGALLHMRKRKAELERIRWELKSSYNKHLKKIEKLENTLKVRYSELSENVTSIIDNDLYKSMIDFRHHGQVSTLEHSERVAAASEKLSKVLGIKNINRKEMLKGALLHDFYLYDWHNEDDGEHKWHGYHHADKARVNADKEFGLSDKEKSIIHSHMWPLNITRIPKSKEAWIVCMADKYVSCVETIFHRK